MTDNQASVLAASTTQAAVTLNPLLWYEIRHLGVDVSGSADTNTIYFAYTAGATVENDASTGDNKLALPSGEVTYVSGVETLNYRCASGAPTFCVNPMGVV